MKISPIATTANTVSAVEGATILKRSLKMATNVTPGLDETPVEDEKINIPDTNIETNDKAEAVSEETQPLSPQFAALAKQRRALQVKEREIADREKALAEQTPTQGDVVTKTLLKSDPLGVLLDAGVTYEQLTEAVLANQNGYNPEIRALKDKIAALEAGVDKKLTDRDAQAEKAALAEMQREAIQLSSQGDDFELVRETHSIPDVILLIEKTYHKTGEVLDVREALQLIETELFKDVMKTAGLKKVQARLAPTQPVLPPQQPQRQMRTLTNRDTASVALSRKARALAAFKGTLNK